IRAPSPVPSIAGAQGDLLARVADPLAARALDVLVAYVGRQVQDAQLEGPGGDRSGRQGQPVVAVPADVVHLLVRVEHSVEPGLDADLPRAAFGRRRVEAEDAESTAPLETGPGFAGAEDLAPLVLMDQGCVAGPVRVGDIHGKE